jgi:outer membrane lipoprotein SlyB
METQSKKVPNSLMWVAGIAIILFCGAGIGAIMGWIPSSRSQTPDPAVPVTTANPPAVPEKTVAATQHRKHVEDGYPAQVRCDTCGVVESTREIDTKGQGSGLGVVGGAVVGGLLGNQVGNGRGKDLATIAGVVGGGYAGNEVEKRSRSTKSYEVTVRMDSGSTRVISLAAAPSWQAGDHVKIVDGAIRSN